MRLDRREAAFVGRLLTPEGSFFHRVAAMACKLGNGWLYLTLPLLLTLLDTAAAGPYFAAAGTSLIAAFVGYSRLKRAIRRCRPCETFPWLDVAVETLDRYSFPSGHSMAAAIIAVPMFFFFPTLSFVGLLWWALVGWCRIALGHHYPSDVAAGSFVGGSLSLGISLAFV